MPIIKRFEGNHFLEDYEEINEHSPLFKPDYIEDELPVPQRATQTKIPLWRKWWTFLKLKFSRI